MASTNKTTNYELSQFIGTDKPTYLGDYNSDMNKIDSAINTVDVKADSAYDKAETNEINIGELDSLETTLKDSIVDAINEVNTKASKIGNVNDLTTTVKTDTVGAINELNSKGLKVLWENPNPANPMSLNETITLNSSDYDYLIVFGRLNTSSNNLCNSLITLKGYNTRISDQWGRGNVGLVSYSRGLDYINDTTYRAGWGEYAIGTSSSVELNASYAIPEKIYGGKF